MSSRRRFLRRAAAAGGAGLAFPAVVAAQGTIAMRWQSAWPDGHPFHGDAVDFAAKVNAMAGGDLRIDLVRLGSAAPADLLDAVSRRALDGAHGALGHHYASDPAFALWGAGPAFGMDADMLLAWHYHGGGKELLARLYAQLGADVVSFLYGPRPAQPLGWFDRRIRHPEDLKGLRFRTEAASLDVFRRMGTRPAALPEADAVAALEAGRLNGAEFEELAADRALGVAEAAKVCMLQSFHQSAEQFEILVNKTKFEALPAQLRALLHNAVAAASAELVWKGLERDSAAYAELRAAAKVAFHRTPDPVLRAELAAYDAASASHRASPLFREIEQSQKAFAERVVRWRLEAQVDRRAAYRHYFGVRRAPKRKS